MNLDDDNIGGGSGGDAGMTNFGHVTKSAKGAYQIGGNQVVLVSRARVDPDPDPLNPLKGGPSKVVLLATGTATGEFVDNGTVEIRGCNGVRVTTGPVETPAASPPVAGDSTDGVEIIASETQSIKIHRGLVDEADQKIEMTPGLPAGAILVDGGAGPVTVQSTTMVTLKVGQSSITLTPEGITINADQVSVIGETISASAVNTMTLKAL